jgi:NADH dehydrogenase FAD-containing subunit
MKEAKSLLVLGAGAGNLETSAKIEKAEMLLTANLTTRDTVQRELKKKKIPKG